MKGTRAPGPCPDARGKNRSGSMNMRLNGFLLFALLPAIAVAQTGTATVSGQISDSTGATIPGAAVKILNVGTGVERKTETNAAGLYTVELLQPGDYEVTAQKEGFRATMRK